MNDIKSYLIAAVAEGGCLSEAARKAGVSYNHAYHIYRKALMSGEAVKRLSQGSRSGHRIPVMCVETGAVYSSMTEAGIANYISTNAISQCVMGKQMTAAGLHWRKYDA